MWRLLKSGSSRLPLERGTVLGLLTLHDPRARPPGEPGARPASGEAVTQTRSSAAAEGGPAANELEMVSPEHYAIVSERARGGIGYIMEAHDRRLDRAVAIKQILPDRPLDEARFLREAKLTAKLQHPSIVPIYEAGRWPNGRP